MLFVFFVNFAMECECENICIFCYNCKCETKNEYFVLLNTCNHFYHLHCLIKWYKVKNVTTHKRKKRCETCLRDFNEKDSYLIDILCCVYNKIKFSKLKKIPKIKRDELLLHYCSIVFYGQDSLNDSLLTTLDQNCVSFAQLAYQDIQKFKNEYV